jgi:hypothetical protein
LSWLAGVGVAETKVAAAVPVEFYLQQILQSLLALRSL